MGRRLPVGRNWKRHGRRAKRCTSAVGSGHVSGGAQAHASRLPGGPHHPFRGGRVQDALGHDGWEASHSAGANALLGGEAERDAFLSVLVQHGLDAIGEFRAPSPVKWAEISGQNS
jgi:hypothetical protein